MIGEKILEKQPRARIPKRVNVKLKGVDSTSRIDGKKLLQSIIIKDHQEKVSVTLQIFHHDVTPQMILEIGKNIKNE